MQGKAIRVDLLKLGLQRPKHHTKVPAVNIPLPFIPTVIPPLPGPFDAVDTIDCRLNPCHAFVIYTGGTRRKQKTEAQRLREDWANLYYFKSRRGCGYEALLEDWGSEIEGCRRKSRRIEHRRLLRGTGA